MYDQARRFNRTLKVNLSIVLFSILFAIAYAQSPLFTSNQNQYFLHGFAQAEFGYLSQDWLANTLDPTPVFSLLVEYTQSYLNFKPIFYMYYAFLMGVYLFSLLGIINLTYDFNSSPTKTLLLLSLIIVVHSAGLRFVLSHTIGANWTYIFEDGVADQRLLGPVFQPSTFGVMLILSLYLFLQDKPYLAVVSAALAATIHPTYLLSAGVLTFTYCLVIWQEQKRLNQTFALAGMALISVTPILYYAFNSFASSASPATEQARQILVNYRIPHHAIIAEWFDMTVIVKLILVTLAIYAIRKKRLFLVLLIPTLAAVLMTLLQAIIQSDALALVFPWRLSTFLVPLSTSLLLAALVDRLFGSTYLASRTKYRFILLNSTFLIFLAVLVGGIRFALDLERKAAQPENELFSYIYANKTSGEIYLTPIKMQDFRLEAGAPVYIDFKSIPYKDSDVMEWYRRNQLADRFYKTGECEVLHALHTDDLVSHVVFASDNQVECPNLKFEEIYRDAEYRLIKILP